MEKINNDVKQQNFLELFTKSTIPSDSFERTNLILDDQYELAYEGIMDAYNAGLYAGLIGPVGVGKTTLCRKIAQDLDRGFYWITFSDLIRPSSLIGSFDPTLVFKIGYSPKSFVPGPFTLACLEGAVFLANEMNRGDEYVLNTLLDALEEKRLYIPQLRTWIKVHEDFFFIASMNPVELKGTRSLPQAVKDRIKVWCTLKYPSRKTEAKIVQVNCGETRINRETLDLILDIISTCRTHNLIEKPPSIRSSIGMARLIAARMEREGLKKADNKFIAEIAGLVLPHSIEVLPGQDPVAVVRSICYEVLGVGRD
ncbi:MAG: AAA domain-containing protein [Candidatus Heimdallarchaeota archaeon]|nr:AAA domain-containing protein [Candidatus Heimdallarchaeota archaeon]